LNKNKKNVIKLIDRGESSVQSACTIITTIISYPY